MHRGCVAVTLDTCVGHRRVGSTTFRVSLLRRFVSLVLEGCGPPGGANVRNDRHHFNKSIHLEIRLHAIHVSFHVSCLAIQRFKTWTRRFRQISINCSTATRSQSCRRASPAYAVTIPHPVYESSFPTSQEVYDTIRLIVDAWWPLFS